ncbi:MAG TPA: hypothetical protein VN228_16955, partial [Pyrinomonadaceae bacterium]|nr:hypothetical protein [Pyrinomonadaceae bacterium]
MASRPGQSLILRVLVYAVLTCGAFAPVCAARTAGPPVVRVSVVTDEAEAVLAVLAKKRAGRAVTDEDWRRVFSSEGYTRLKKRELAMRRPFDDADFRAFVLSDELSARAPALAETLGRWRRADA